MNPNDRHDLSDMPIPSIEAIPYGIVVLDENLRIVRANPYSECLPWHERPIEGKTLGEALGCHHAQKSGFGCGENLPCANCGFRSALLLALEQSIPTSGEAKVQVLRDNNERVELKITTALLTAPGMKGLIVGLRDVTKEAEKVDLDRIFCHDLLNTASRLLNIATVLSCVKEEKDEAETVFVQRLLQSVRDLIHELHNHKKIVFEQSSGLNLEIEKFSLWEFLEEIQAIFAAYPESETRRFVISRVPKDWEISSNRSIVKQVLENMIKNALEATASEEQITLDCSRRGEEIIFSIHNPTVMSETAADRIFSSIYSTKSELGRGIGTHSMKVLSEKYLGGNVGFLSRHELGTIFFLRIPFALQEGSDNHEDGRASRVGRFL